MSARRTFALSSPGVSERAPRALRLRQVVQARLWAQRRLYVALWSAMVLGTALLVALPATSFLSEAGGLQLTIGGRDSRSNAIQVHKVSTADPHVFSDFQDSIRRQAKVDIHDYLSVITFSAASRYFNVTSRNGVPVTAAACCQVIRFVSHEQLEAHVVFSGDSVLSPRSANLIQATVSDSAARTLNVRVGDRLCTDDGLRPDALCLVIIGTWKQRDAGEDFWAADSITAESVYVSQDDLFGKVKYALQAYDLAAVLAPNLTKINHADPVSVSDALSEVGPALGGNIPGFQVIQSIDSVVATYRARDVVGALALQIVSAQIWFVGLGAVLFATFLKLSQDGVTIAVLRSRGWPRRLVATLLGIEIGTTVLMALFPGIGLGVATALFVTRLVYPLNAVSLLTLLEHIAWNVAIGWLAGVAAIALVVVSICWSAAHHPRRALRDRPSWWERTPFVVAAIVFSVLALVEARTLGDARLREAGATQPWDLFLPGLAVAAAGIACMPLIRMAGHAAWRVASRAETRLGSIQFARAPAQQQGLALLLAGTIALGVLAATYSGTSTRNSADRAAYSVGADVSATTQPGPPVDLQTISVAQAGSQTTVFRSFARPGSSLVDLPMLGVDPWSFRETAWTPPGLGASGMDQLLSRLARSEPPTLMLPPNADGLSVWMFGADTGGELVIQLSDAVGRPVALPMGDLGFHGWKQLTSSLPTSVLTQPIRVRRLTFTPVNRAGTVAFSHLAATVAGREITVEGFSAVADNGWWMSDGESGGYLQPITADSSYTRAGNPTAHLYLDPSYLPISLHAPVTVTTGATRGPGIREAVPVVVTPGTLAAIHAKVGDTVGFTFSSHAVSALIVGEADQFPTLYGDFAVFSLEPLLEVLGADAYLGAWPDELWIKTGTPDTVATSLRDQPGIERVTTIRSVQREKESDPLVLAGRVNLMIGFLAILVLAIGSFSVHAAIVASSRRAEYAVLEANGVDHDQVTRAIRFEQGLLLAISVTIGATLGAILSVILVPSLEVSTSREDLVPPTILGLDVFLLAICVTVTIAGALVAGTLASRATRVHNIMSELRRLE